MYNGLFVKILLEGKADCVKSIDRFLNVLVEHTTNIITTGKLSNWHRTIVKEKNEIDKKRKCAFLSKDLDLANHIDTYLTNTKTQQLVELNNRLKLKKLTQIANVDYDVLIKLVIIMVLDSTLNEDKVLSILNNYINLDAVLY